MARALQQQWIGGPGYAAERGAASKQLRRPWRLLEIAADSNRSKCLDGLFALRLRWLPVGADWRAMLMARHVDCCLWMLLDLPRSTCRGRRLPVCSCSRSNSAASSDRVHQRLHALSSAAGSLSLRAADQQARSARPESGSRCISHALQALVERTRGAVRLLACERHARALHTHRLPAAAGLQARSLPGAGISAQHQCRASVPSISAEHQCRAGCTSCRCAAALRLAAAVHRVARQRYIPGLSSAVQAAAPLKVGRRAPPLSASSPHGPARRVRIPAHRVPACEVTPSSLLHSRPCVATCQLAPPPPPPGTCSLCLRCRCSPGPSRWPAAPPPRARLSGGRGGGSR